MKKVPIDKEELLIAFARETARMSYPGSMSRGKHPVVKEGTKKVIECYFTSQFPIGHIWDNASTIKSTSKYDQWHSERTREIAKEVESYKGSEKNKPEAIAAKFLDTFMYHLMKFQNCRPLFKHLHLPLDRRVFGALRSRNLSFPDKKRIQAIIRKSPYTIEYPEYRKVQKALYSLVKIINERLQLDPTDALTSRVELNCFLWSFDDKEKSRSLA